MDFHFMNYAIRMRPNQVIYHYRVRPRQRQRQK